MITPIPLPADDCDRCHSMHAALSSLGAATASFDAAMDSLSATTARYRRRVTDLERRMTKFQELLRRLDNVAARKNIQMKEGGLDDKVCMLFCPASYEDALKGMETELEKVRHELDSANPNEGAVRLGTMSSRDLVRSAADDAVQKSLRSDVQRDNGEAVPSDAWLDHASMGLGVGRALEMTNEQRSVPLLLGDDNRKGETDYQIILDRLVQNAANASSNKRDGGFDRLESLEGYPPGRGGGGDGDDESVYSVASQMSAISVASSTRMTAGQRRRWHKQQQMQIGGRATSKASSMQMNPVLPSHPEESPQTSAVAGRQQSNTASQPYLCEVFHDSFGIGLEPPKGLVDCSGFSGRRSREGGSEFYPPSSHVTDMLVFNTTRNSYGMRLEKPAPMAGAPYVVGSASSDKAAQGTRDEKGVSHSVSPSVAKKKQLRVSVNKPTDQLSHLVFKADANADEGKAKPKLDLPAGLPDGSS